MLFVKCWIHIHTCAHESDRPSHRPRSLSQTFGRRYNRGSRASAVVVLPKLRNPVVLKYHIIKYTYAYNNNYYYYRIGRRDANVVVSCHVRIIYGVISIYLLIILIFLCTNSSGSSLSRVDHRIHDGIVMTFNNELK